MSEKAIELLRQASQALQAEAALAPVCNLILPPVPDEGQGMLLTELLSPATLEWIEKKKR